MIPSYDYTSPYNDELMVYNKFDNRYVINLSGSNKAFGDDTWIEMVGGNDNAEWILDLISSTVYSVIDSYTDSKYRDKFRYFYSHSKRARQAIYKILKDVCFYTEQDGGLYTAYASGLNFNEMKAFDMTLTQYVGRMAQQYLLNGGLGERIPRFDFDRLTSTFNSKHDLLVYMDKKGYIDIEDYYYRITIKGDGSDFNQFIYDELIELKKDLVAIESPIIFDTNKELLYVLEEYNTNDITFIFEEGYSIILNSNGSLGGSPIQQDEFFIDFKLQDEEQPKIPNSSKYQVVCDINGEWLLYEFNQWQTILEEKGVEW